MSNKKLLAVVNGETIDAKQEQTGVKSVELVNAEILDTEVSDLTGLIAVTDETNNSSAIVTVHMNAGSIVLLSVEGSSDYSDTKDTASKVNVYVESDKLQIQNNTAGTLTLSAKIL